MTKPVVLLMVLLLCACTAAPPLPSAPVSSIPATVTMVDTRARLIDDLLSKAEQAFGEDRLRFPADDSAFYWYRAVLDIDGGNVHAHQGMRNIAQRYLTLAADAFASGGYDRAQQLLDGAEAIAVPPAEIARLRAQYRPPAQAANEFRLPLQQLDSRSEALTQQLMDVAVKAREHDSRLLIVARNDAEGRWIYRLMRDAVDGYRLRGNIEVGQWPRVVLIDLAK